MQRRTYIIKVEQLSSVCEKMSHQKVHTDTLPMVHIKSTEPNFINTD